MFSPPVHSLPMRLTSCTVPNITTNRSKRHSKEPECDPRAMSERNSPCPHHGCGNTPLNGAQHEQGWKSCPECSVNNDLHIFYPFSSFGYSEERVTSHEPDGIHSWCTSCRAPPQGYKGIGPNGEKCDGHIDEVRNKHSDRSRN